MSPASCNTPSVRNIGRNDKVEANQSDPRKLWQLVDDLLGRGRRHTRVTWWLPSCCDVWQPQTSPKVAQYIASCEFTVIWPGRPPQHLLSSCLSSDSKKHYDWTFVTFLAEVGFETKTQLEGCIVWNDTIQYSSELSTIRAHAVYFLHSTMPSVTYLRLSDASVICRGYLFSVFNSVCFSSIHRSLGSTNTAAYYWF